MTSKVVNIQIGIPIVNPRRFMVAIKGGPMFPKHGKEQVSPCIRDPWFETSRTSPIDSNSMNEKYIRPSTRLIDEKHHKTIKMTNKYNQGNFLSKRRVREGPFGC